MARCAGSGGMLATATDIGKRAAVADRRAELGKGTGRDGQPGFLQEIQSEVQVVDRQQSVGGEFTGHHQMPEVRPAVAPASGAGTFGVNGSCMV